MKLARKLLTRPIHWYERSRKYSIVGKIFTLPPCQFQLVSSKILAVLTTPDKIAEAAWTAYSLLKHLSADYGLYIIVDGEITQAAGQQLNLLFPQTRIASTFEIMSEMQAMTPNVCAYAKVHPMGRKLAVNLFLQQHFDVLYSDSDVLCFGPMPELQAKLSSPEVAYIQDTHQLCSDPLVLEKARELGYDYEPNLNGGLLYTPRQSMRIDIAEQLLADGEYDVKSWFSEQTVNAVLMRQANAKPLPKYRYVVSNQRQFYFEQDVDYAAIAVRHFTNPVRHLMYMKGMPFLLKQWQKT